MARSFRRLCNALFGRAEARKPVPAVALRTKRFRPTLETLENRLAPASVIWDNGGQDGLWENPLNWDNDLIPGGGDVAVIGPGYTIVDNLPYTEVDAISCQSMITFNGALTIGGVIINSYIDKYVAFNGELTLGGTMVLGDLMGGGGIFNADVHIAAGKELQLGANTYGFATGVDVDGLGLVRVYSATASIGSGAVSFANLTLMSSMSKLLGDSGGTATITKKMNFLGGRLEGAAKLIIAAGASNELNFAEGGDKLLLGWQVENYATTNWTAGNIVSQASVFTNKAGGTFELGYSGGNWTATGGSFENLGTFKSSGVPDPFGTGNGHNLAIEFNSSNLVNVLTGSLVLTASGEFAGNVVANAAANVFLGAGEFILNPGLEIQGQGIMIQGGANTRANASNLL